MEERQALLPMIMHRLPAMRLDPEGNVISSRRLGGGGGTGVEGGLLATLLHMGPGKGGLPDGSQQLVHELRVLHPPRRSLRHYHLLRRDDQLRIPAAVATFLTGMSCLTVGPLQSFLMNGVQESTHAST